MFHLFSLLLACVAIVIIAPLLVAIFLITSKYRKAGVIVLSIYGFLIASLLVCGLIARRSVPGRILRHVNGERLAAQKINDLAEDVRIVPTMEQLQPWAMETIARFRAGKTFTNDYRPAADFNYAVMLAQEKRPEFIKQQWGRQKWEALPIVCVVLSTNPQPIPLMSADAQLLLSSTNLAPECVAIVCGGGGMFTGFYRSNYGLIVGPTNYFFQSNIWLPYIKLKWVKVKPGIYAYLAVNP
jgi:hypothetical protein